MTANPTGFLTLDKLLVYSPLGLTFVDDFTGQLELGTSTRP